MIGIRAGDSLIHDERLGIRRKGGVPVACALPPLTFALIEVLFPDAGVPTSHGVIHGLELRENQYIPDGEAWLIDAEGKVIKVLHLTMGTENAQDKPDGFDDRQA